MSVESPVPKDLSALRITRDREPRRPAGMLIFLAVLAVAVGVGIYVAASGALAVKTVETVSASIVTEGQAETLLSATGYVEADTKADLSPKITSKITALYVTEGDRVKKGQVLARLDRTDLDAQLADTKAAWVNAAAELARQRALVKAGLASTSALDASIANEASAHARVRFVQAQQDYAVIRAPFSGRVIAKRAHVGEAVSPFGSPGQGSSNGGAIVTLVDFSTLYVGADVNESNLGRLKADQPAELTLDAYPDQTYHGHLLQIIPTADRSKGTVKVKVAFEDPDDRILPDMSARVNFTAKKTTGETAAKTRVTIPKSAIAAEAGKSGVFLVSDRKAIFREIEAGAENSGQVEIRKGLQGGERLVSEPGKIALKSGDKIKVKGE